MPNLPLSAEDRAELYAARRNLTIEKSLGFGNDGSVFATSDRTAIKCLKYQSLFENELAIYQHLTHLGLVNVNEFEIPALVNFCEELLVIEMTIVTPPYVLDFASARLKGFETRYDEEQMAEWKLEKAEQFEDDWPQVQRMVWTFERHGIVLADVHPRNVACR